MSDLPDDGQFDYYWRAEAAKITRERDELKDRCAYAVLDRDFWHKAADERSAELCRVMAERDELKAKVAELEAIIEPVKSWYDGDGKFTDAATMLRLAIHDLQTDREENLSFRARIAELEKEKSSLLAIIKEAYTQAGCEGVRCAPWEEKARQSLAAAMERKES